MDGSGSEWWPDSSTSNHPYMVRLSHCSDVLVDGVTLQNSAKLTLAPSHCDRVKIYNVTIKNPYTSSSKNLDCIDPSGTDHHIKDCTLLCGDDNVAVKVKILKGCSQLILYMYVREDELQILK